MAKQRNHKKMLWVLILSFTVLMLLLSGCSEEIVDREHVHTPVTVQGVPATCLAGGLSDGSYCATCGEVITEQQTTPPTGHTEVADPAVAATCSATGLTEGSHCSVCGEVIVEQTVTPKTDHSFGEEVSCDQDQTCSVCGIVVKSEGGHAVVIDDEIKATCTSDGKTEGSHCAVCGEIIKAQEVIKAKGHEEVVSPAVDATCEAAGKTESIVCSECGKVIKAEELIPATGHSEVLRSETEPTCTEPGYNGGSYCENCGKDIQSGEVSPALGHTIVTDPEIPATCSADGMTEGQRCEVCGEVLVAQEIIPATGHTVTFQDWDGRLIMAVNVPCGGNATPPYDPYRPGYMFTGWMGSLSNVTEDRVIIATYVEDAGSETVPDDSGNQPPTDGSPYLELATINADEGDKNVAVQIMIKNCPGVAGMAINISYDNGLTLKDVVYNSEIGGINLPPETIDKNPFVLLWVNAGEDFGGDFLFATLYFDVGYTDLSKLGVTAFIEPGMVTNLNEQEILFSIVNGGVIIE